MAPKKPNSPASELDAWFEKVFDRKNFSNLTDDMRKNAKSFFASVGGNAGIVSRNEFEAQKKAVADLANAITKLEARLDKLADKKTAAKKATRKSAKKPSSSR